MNERKDVYDCVIVGGGSAGLSAALTLGRARRRVLVADTGNPRNAPAHNAHNFFTRDGTPPLELLRIGREQLKPYETVELRATGVKQIEKTGEHFRVVFDDGTTRTARKILLAFGVVDEFPPIENFAEFWGKTVFHCPYCHGFEVRDAPLALVANGAAALERASLLENWSRDLILCTNGTADISAADRALLEKRRIQVREEKILKFEGSDGRLEAIVFETGEKLRRRGLMINPKQRLRSDLAQKLGCRLSESGFIKVAEFNETTVKGVYAAGDIAAQQAIGIAVSSGMTVAAGINHALIKTDFV